MDRIWQWAWDRYGARYSWAAFAITVVLGAPAFLVWSFIVVALQKSDRYVEAAVVTVAVVVLLQYLIVLPGLGSLRVVERWAAGHEVDPARALDSTYVYARGAAARAVEVTAVWAALLFAGVGAIAGASGSRLAEYAILGAAAGGIGQLMTVHSYVEGALRPARVSIAGDTGIGDSLPRSRPTFAAWSNLSMLAVAFTNAISAAMLAAVFASTIDAPVLAIVIACVLVIGFTPITVGAIFAPSLQPIRDLAAGTKRVAAGDYSQRVPVVQDDDLGALSASFNRMQAGLAERQRLQAAFGTYVDPALAARLLEQGDDVFTGERRQVTVMFVDIRDFTPFAEANTAEDTVARLNALFEIVVPAIVEGGGHVNKLGMSTSSSATVPWRSSVPPTISPIMPTPR